MKIRETIEKTAKNVTKKGREKRDTDPSHDEIAAMAFHLWSERGGDALQNWLEAEQQLHQSSRREA